MHKAMCLHFSQLLILYLTNIWKRLFAIRPRIPVPGKIELSCGTRVLKNGYLPASVSVNTVITLVIQLSLKTVESPRNVLQPHPGATLLISIVFNETNKISVITALTVRWRWCLVPSQVCGVVRIFQYPDRAFPSCKMAVHMRVSYYIAPGGMELDRMGRFIELMGELKYGFFPTKSIKNQLLSDLDKFTQWITCIVYPSSKDSRV